MLILTGDQVRSEARDDAYRGAEGFPRGDRARCEPHRVGGVAACPLPQDGRSLLHHQGQGAGTQILDFEENRSRVVRRHNHFLRALVRSTEYRPTRYAFSDHFLITFCPVAVDSCKTGRGKYVECQTNEISVCKLIDFSANDTCYTNQPSGFVSGVAL